MIADMPEPEAAPHKVRLMRITDPSMCLKCRFAHFADVSFPSGLSKRMFYCSRLDCDNWTSESEPDEGELFE
jgi:hypothetical protein